jgi:hypothetical protein
MDRSRNRCNHSSCSASLMRWGALHSDAVVLVALIPRHNCLADAKAISEFSLAQTMGNSLPGAICLPNCPPSHRRHDRIHPDRVQRHPSAPPKPAAIAASPRRAASTSTISAPRPGCSGRAATRQLFQSPRCLSSVKLRQPLFTAGLPRPTRQSTRGTYPSMTTDVANINLGSTREDLG